MLPSSRDPDFRLPPHSVEAEQALIGGLMLDSRAWEKVEAVVTSQDFYRQEHRCIFSHLERMFAEGVPVDVVTVFERISAAGDGHKTGGLAYLGELANNTPSAANISRYAQIVRERSLLRQLVAVANDVAEEALRPSKRPAADIIDEAARQVLAVSESANGGREGFRHIEHPVAAVMDRLSELYDRNAPDELTGIPTGFYKLDEITSGLQPGDLVIIAGRPSMGKTAVALNIAEHVAVQAQKPVAVFSMEMGATQLALRLLASLARVDASVLRSARLREDDWTRLASAMGRLIEAPLFIDESGGLTPGALRSRTRKLAREHGPLGLVVIDYLQLMTTGEPGENRNAEISAISRAIKALAKELQVPVIALSQLSRKVEERADKRPMMSDLRESGAIEQDADVILMMYRDDYYNKESQQPGMAEMIIGKHRNGPTGTVELVYLKEYTRFENPAHVYSH